MKQYYDLLEQGRRLSLGKSSKPSLLVLRETEGGRGLWHRSILRDLQEELDHSSACKLSEYRGPTNLDFSSGLSQAWLATIPKCQDLGCQALARRYEGFRHSISAIGGYNKGEKGRDYIRRIGVP